METTAIIPLVSSIFVFTLGFFVFFKNSRSMVNLTFFFHALSITVWLFGTFMMFLNKGSMTEVIFWDRFIYIGVVFIPAFMYHFCLAITNRKGDFFLYLAYFFSTFFLIISRTDYFVKDVFVYQWGVHTKAQLFHHIFLVYFCSYAIVWFITVYRYYKKSNLASEKLQFKYFFIAFLLLFTIGPLAYLPAYGIGIYPFSYLSGLIFVIILTYGITRHNLMDIKIIATEVFSGLLILAALIPIFQTKSALEFFMRVIVLLITIIFAALLVRSVHTEVRRREEMEQLAQKLKKTSDELAKANEGLKQLDNAKSEFISIASHQLRTPLTAIKGFISMILDGDFGPLSEKIKNGLAKTYIANERLIRLVDDLLDISRIESGKQKFQWSKVHLEDMAVPIVEELKNIAKMKGLKLVFHKPPKPTPLVVVDADKLHQVMMNFIDNSIKYTKIGKVEVFVTPEPKGSVTFCVKDTGLGIALDVKPFLFQKFSRGKGSFQIHTEGLGLGLYVAKLMIDAHKGKIWAESEGPDKGSSFCFSLPAAKAEK